MDLLSPLIKDAANNYIANLTDLASMLVTSIASRA
tara:strand:+ start:319 stop:423 length:105 start_codon:yes stop_codon:yes gene_type:complete